jgi:arsenate reductase
MIEVENKTLDRSALTLLFVCTHNRCRSILCEALSRHLSNGRIDAYSAGSYPSGNVHPETLKHLEKRGIDTTDLCSTSWDSYDGVSFDAVLTVCDSAAGEQCPAWFGKTTKVHWGLPDPSKVEGGEDRDMAFDAVIETVQQRLGSLLAHDLKTLRGESLRDVLQNIGNENY